MANTFHETHSASRNAMGLRIALTMGVLLLAALVGYNLFLVRAHLDSVTVGLALADSIIMLVLSLLANRNIARVTRQPSAWYGIVCGLILGVLFAGTTISSVFLVSNAVLRTGYHALELTSEGHLLPLYRTTEKSKGEVLLPIALSALYLIREGEDKRLHK
jgi:hypothetical protein